MVRPSDPPNAEHGETHAKIEPRPWMPRLHAPWLHRLEQEELLWKRDLEQTFKIRKHLALAWSLPSLRPMLAQICATGESLADGEFPPS